MIWSNAIGCYFHGIKYSIFNYIYEVSVTAGTVPKCDDVDTQACRLMLAKQTDLCQNHAVAESLCKRFCNLCRKYAHTLV